MESENGTLLESTPLPKTGFFSEQTFTCAVTPDLPEVECCLKAYVTLVRRIAFNSSSSTYYLSLPLKGGEATEFSKVDSRKGMTR